MKITTEWEATDIKAGVKPVCIRSNQLNGTIVRLPPPARKDNVVEPSKFAVMQSSFEMTTEFMSASKLALLLTEFGCTL